MKIITSMSPLSGGISIILCLFGACDQSNSSSVLSKISEPTKMVMTSLVNNQIENSVPNISWEERSQYEKEGQIVYFYDCGLYVGDSNEFAGAKCQYKNNVWLLLEQKYEPLDNLVEDGDMNKFYIENIIISGANFRLGNILNNKWVIKYFVQDDYKSIIKTKIEKSHDNHINKPNSLKIEQNSDGNDILNYRLTVYPDIKNKLNGKWVTLSTSVKIENDNVSNDNKVSVSLAEFTSSEKNLQRNIYYAENSKDINGFTNYWLIKKIDYSFAEIQIYFDVTQKSIIIDRLHLIQGKFPMSFKAN